MTQLWWSVALIVVLMLISVWRVLSRTMTESTPDRLSVNRQAYREREQEIERQFAAGELSSDDKSRLLTENARQFLSEADGHYSSATRRDRTAVFVFMATLLVAGCIGLYSWLGASSKVLSWQQLQERAAQDSQHKSSMEEMLLLLRTRLQHDPDDSEGWFMLGRSMLSLQQPQLAAQAFARARRLSPNDPDVLVAYAQSLRLGEAEGSGAEVDRLLQQARVVNPVHEGANLMTAYRHFEKGEYAEAIPLFEQLKQGRAGDSEAISMLDSSIARTKEGLAAKSAAVSPASTSSTEPSAANSPEQIRVKVEIAEAVRKAAPADARVFIYARALRGPPMPLAVVTTTVAQLPTTVSLSDANAMNAALKLSSQNDIQLIARISRSGNANATPGDWQGDLNIVNWRQNNSATIVIQKQL